MIRPAASRTFRSAPRRARVAWVALWVLLFQLALPLAHHPVASAPPPPAVAGGDCLLHGGVPSPPPDPAPDHERRRSDGIPCPICSALQLAGKALPPAPVALPPAALAPRPALAAVDADLPPQSFLTHHHARAPPPIG